MKNASFRILFLFTIFCFSCSNDSTETTGEAKQKTQLTVKGSDTVLPVGQKEAEDYMKSDSTVSISVVGGGSGVGIAALLDGTTDIAMSSRDLKTEEKLKFQDKKIEIVETIIGYDALSVVVNPENKVSKLTREQIEDIFTGKITNWKEVGGDDEKIVVYSRESSSGTYEFFKEHVMGKKNYSNSVLSLSSTGAIVQSVGQTKGAIGYVGLAYSDKSVKAIDISYDQGATFVAPSLESAKNKTYPVSRPLYFFYDKSKAANVKGFIDFILAPGGQKTVESIGYIPVN
ncbi:MAG: phosphate ABC transporter substrate-binding protein [Bacteroidota bacterium]|nr:phosphate ABC transporter substrate-binding protein [Bacteroidota bacterium]